MLQIRDLTVTMKKDLRDLLRGFTFALNPGDKAAIIGEEGNGKSTLLKALEAEGYTVPAAGEVDFSLLSGETEQALIKKIAAYSQVVRLAARDYDPSHINRYLTELAGDFHRFYTACRIKGEERPVLLARLKLADTARSVLKNAMTLIGCTAPEKM